MESRRSKKTRFYGDASKSSRDPNQSLTSPTSASRPLLKDRVKSAPLIAQPAKSKHDLRAKQASVKPLVREEDQGRTLPSAPVCSLSSPAGHQEPCTSSTNVSKRALETTKMREVTLVVLGATQAGKSTFVECALDLKRPSTSPSATKKVSLEGVVSVLRLLEMQIGDVVVNADRNVEWPQTVGGQSTPQVDGVLVLYDVMNKGSLNRVPYVLSAFSKAALPTVLVSSKCDNPPNSWEVDAGKVEGFCTQLDGVESFQTSATAPETHKRCVSIILKNITAERPGMPASYRASRPRASTTSQSPNRGSVAQAPAMKPKHAPKHTHATSDFPGSIPRDTARQSPGSMLTGLEGFSPPSKNILTQQYQSSPNTPSGDLEGQILDAAQNCQETEGGGEPKEALLESSTSIDIADDRKVEEVPNPIGRQDYSDTRPAPTSIVNSFLDIGDDNIAQAAEDSEISTAAIQQEPSRGYGLSFDDLVDRLLAQSRSKLDRKFTAIFLCLYRKFATPSELVSAIIHRFQLISDSSNPQISRITSQLRYLAVLAQWVSDYPEDFAHPQTRRMVTGFVSSISSNRLFAVASKEIGISLEVVSEDDYAGWAGSHKSRSRANTVDSFLSMSSVQSTASTLNAQSSSEDILATASTDVAATLPHARSSATPSLSSSIGQSENQSTGSFQTLLNSVENAQRQAQLLTPMPRNPLSKIQWHQLMNTADEDVARELTRIDWIMFSSIRPRDLVRHVSLSGPEKDKCKSLEHVNRMIDQFNHVAFWVANLILLRDKPKHRAKMLEKFMSVAWKLRQLNNYNSLGAVVAGINGTAVHRLAQTRELVPHQAQKQFMRLEILMGTQKSHFAYRLGWANTSSERIPFLPLHRRDLVLAEDGNRTYLDAENTRINWKKFDIMGEVVISIQKSQGTPYPTISRNEELQRLVLDGKFAKDDDEIYERSIQIEGPGVGEIRRRFNWFQR